MSSTFFTDGSSPFSKARYTSRKSSGCHRIIPDFFICIGNCSTKFCVKKCKCPSIFTEFFCVCRIPVTVYIIPRKQFLIKFCIFFLQFYGKLSSSLSSMTAVFSKSRHILKEIQKIRLLQLFQYRFRQFDLLPDHRVLFSNSSTLSSPPFEFNLVIDHMSQLNMFVHQPLHIFPYFPGTLLAVCPPFLLYI